MADSPSDPTNAEGTNAGSTAPSRAAAPSPFGPLKSPVFRMLWVTWLTANVCMWMSDVAAAWLMTSLTTEPIWVALVQTAATIPVFLLGLPSGALADILDRRRYFMITQFWLAASATALWLASVMEVITAPLLLALTFLNGIGLAMRWPVFAAIIPEVVPRHQLPQAMGLNAVAMNTSRILGPLIAGALIAGAGTAWVFALNAALSVVAGLIIMRWQRVQRPHPLGREPFFSAIRVGLQFTRQSPHLRGVLVRVFLIFFHFTGLLALLPLVAQGLGGGAGGFTLLLASMGLGAITMALLLPRLRHHLEPQRLLVLGILLQAVVTAAVALAPNLTLAAPVMYLAGMAWLSNANSLSVSAQMALPDWVRARGMSVFQMGIMGGSALGAAVWGQVATVTSLQTSLLLTAASGVLALLLTRRRLPDISIEEDLTPSRALQPPVAEAPPRGRVLVHIEYLIDPKQDEAFRALMEESRRSRLRQGALEWALLHDMGEPGRFIEQVTDESWTEHLRRFDRITATDAALREKKRAYHLPQDPPIVTRYVLEDPRHLPPRSGADNQNDS
jgi:MFS family permease